MRRVTSIWEGSLEFYSSDAEYSTLITADVKSGASHAANGTCVGALKPPISAVRHYHARQGTSGSTESRRGHASEVKSSERPPAAIQIAVHASVQVILRNITGTSAGQGECQVGR